MLLTDVFHFFKSIYLYCYTDEKFKECRKEDMTLCTITDVKDAQVVYLVPMLLSLRSIN